MNTNDILREIIKFSKALHFAIQIDSFDQGCLRRHLRKKLKEALKGTFVEGSTDSICDRCIPEEGDFSADRMIEAVESWIAEGSPPRQFRGDKLGDDLGM